ncbi:stage II sporulation protein M [Methanocalculus sp.]|uniref:stage II sporulation protein M n=1 Tax=Methanocalculus sp. TaxID=2004547 RepID=UPI002720533E|nr:stage II sporulation protein M [Methanocalculus sp.]MDO8842223.1 stage II sporulation protein M [Methanocalculus sp.]
MSKAILYSILLSVLIFSGSTLFGAGLIIYNPALGDTFMEVLHESLDIEEMMNDPPATMALKLFMNNLQACIILFLGGVTFGLLTVFILAMNGVIVGAIAHIALGLQGGVFVIAALLPHGIVELPALFISGALGFMLASAIRREWNGEGDAALEAMHYASLFAKTVLPLLVIAAITEAFITPGIIVMVV